MTVARMLADLAVAGWTVRLESVDPEEPDRWRITVESDRWGSASYTGALGSVVARAWAGERGEG